MREKYRSRLSLLKAILACFGILQFTSCGNNNGGGGASSLAKGFADPPISARPRAYYIWVNGNFSLSQITRDLEEIKEKGMGGFDIYDKGTRDPDHVIPDGPPFMGEESVEAICHTIREATRLGLELGLITSSSANAGGAWVTPEYAIKGLYISETAIEGGKPFAGVLPFPKFPDRAPKGGDKMPLYYRDVAVLAVPAAPDSFVEDSSSVHDLSDRMGSDGSIEWDAPEGAWKILRFVCTNTGQRLAIPSPNSGGLSIDHFNPKATERHFNYIIDKLKKELGSFEGTALKYMYLQSYELRGLTWTENLPEEFRKRRGYDMKPYLPVLAGMTIQDKETTARFLYDFRKTLSDLIVENHYGRAREILNSHGLELCAEAGGPGQPLHNCPFEALRALGTLDIPRGEFWNKHEVLDENGIDILWLVKEIACAAHIYGKRFVEGEAFASWLHWQESPYDLKPLADKAMCEGLNRFVFHTYSHSPGEAGLPGWVHYAGTHINANRVWWPMAKPFIMYLSRSCYLLQQGHFVGDVCYYYGDHAPNFVKPKHIDPSLGYGYDYDVANSDVILNRMDVRDGRIVLPDGMSYEILVLPDREDMNPDVLEKIISLVERGATVVGPKPVRANGLTDYPNRDNRVKELAEELWGELDGKRAVERSSGKGKVIWGRSLREILAARGIAPDFSVTGGDETSLDYIHRRTENEDIYFIINTTNRRKYAECVFRVKGKIPELWMPDTGEMRPMPVYRESDAGMIIPLDLPPNGSVFLVFRGAPDNNHIVRIMKDDITLFPSSPDPGGVPATCEIIGTGPGGFELHAGEGGKYMVETGWGERREIAVPQAEAPLEIAGPWEVRFPYGWGAPPRKIFPRLISWTDDGDEGIRYFSGIAAYHKELDIPEGMVSPDNMLILDLGTVRCVAQAYLNGKPLGILWKEPFNIDITHAAKPGVNRLVVEVANTWSNRVTGDARLPKEKRHTNTNIASPTTYGIPWKDAPLLESGLLGPVRLQCVKKMRFEIPE